MSAQGGNSSGGMARRIARAVLPSSMRSSIRRIVKSVHLGELDRVEPISRSFGIDRGRPIDRFYIEQFLEHQTDDIRGRVLEFGDDRYIRQFGGDCVTRHDVLHVSEGNDQATIVADISDAPHIDSDCFDCIICTQLLMFVYDIRAGVSALHRILKPGGVALVTVAGLSQICRYDLERWGDFWRFTGMSMKRLFEEEFTGGKVAVESHGNVLAAVGFLHGLAVEDMNRRDLEFRDRDYELVITVRAQKAGS